jgi:hypothetical protein
MLNLILINFFSIMFKYGFILKLIYQFLLINLILLTNLAILEFIKIKVLFKFISNEL